MKCQQCGSNYCDCRLHDGDKNFLRIEREANEREDAAAIERDKRGQRKRDAAGEESLTTRWATPMEPIPGNSVVMLNAKVLCNGYISEVIGLPSGAMDLNGVHNRYVAGVVKGIQDCTDKIKITIAGVATVRISKPVQPGDWLEADLFGMVRPQDVQGKLTPLTVGVSLSRGNCRNTAVKCILNIMRGEGPPWRVKSI